MDKHKKGESENGMKPVFYQCEQCKIVMEVLTGQEENFQCGQVPMKKIEANTSEGAAEKHLPVVKQNGQEIVVEVGSVFHPMSAEHSIEWVYLQTEKGAQRVFLKPEEEPVARFCVASGDKAVAAYAFCNLHGFWKTEIS